MKEATVELPFCIVLASVLLTAIVVSATPAYIIILNHGLVTEMVIAQSGSVDHIQQAVDEAIRLGRPGVKIPEGNFTFDATGSRRVNINVPATGLKIQGAGINRTVLQLPQDETNSQTNMFNVDGKSHGKLVITGITFKGRAYVGSTTGDTGIFLGSCRDFRIYNCSFHDLGSAGIWIMDHWNLFGNGNSQWVSQGVIDHCSFYNIFKQGALDAKTGYGYGVDLGRCYNIDYTPWETNMSKILGVYDQNVFVEDCFFAACRHAVACSSGGVYVFRHNTVVKQAYNEIVLTGHPARGISATEGWTPSHRAYEVYDNVFDRSVAGGTVMKGIYCKGGGGVIYNNTFRGMNEAINIGNAGCSDPRLVKCYVHDLYFWSNTLFNTPTLYSVLDADASTVPRAVLNIDFFPNAPAFNYTPYQYPHPLTQ
jgi:hypothetical protein